MKNTNTRLRLRGALLGRQPLELLVLPAHPVRLPALDVGALVGQRDGLQISLRRRDALLAPRRRRKKISVSLDKVFLTIRFCDTPFPAWSGQKGVSLNLPVYFLTPPP